MYHPSRGGVRGGADQFSWENVKTDKHRENYLGHSVMAPVGRWQKGKDLSWYSKDRSKNAEEKNSNFSEIAAVKRAEEEAMLAALGHKVVKKEAQPLTKEEVAEVLKRNQGERESLGVDRVEGVGIASARAAMLVHPGKHGGTKTGGVTFEAPPLDETNPAVNSSKELNKESYFQKSSSNTGKKGSKKHKKEKKHKKKKKHKKRAYSGSSDNEKEIKSANERSAEKHFIPKACKNMSEDFMLLKCSASNENDYRNSLMNKDIQSNNKRKERQLSASESDSGTKYDAVKEAFSSDSESNGHILYNKERTKAHSYGKPYNKRKRHDSTSDSEPDKKGSQSREVKDSTSELTSEIEYNQRDFKTEFDLKDFSSKHSTYKSSKNTTSVSQCHNIYEENRNVDSQKYKFSSSHALRDSSTSIHYKKKSDTNFKYMYKSSEKKSDKCAEIFCGRDLTKKQRQRHDSSSD